MAVDNRPFRTKNPEIQLEKHVGRIWWHRCDRWWKVGLNCPLRGFDEQPEPLDDEPRVIPVEDEKFREKHPIQKNAQIEVLLEKVAALPLAQEAGALAPAIAAPAVQVPGAAPAPAPIGVPTGRTAGRKAAVKHAQHLGTKAVTKMAGKDPVKWAETFMSRVGLVSGSTPNDTSASVTNAVGGSSTGVQPPSAPTAMAELKSTEIAESALARSAARSSKRSRKRGDEGQQAVEEAERLVKAPQPGGDSRQKKPVSQGAPVPVGASEFTKTRMRAALAMIAVAGAFHLSRNTPMGRMPGFTPAGGGFHKRDVIGANAGAISFGMDF